MVESLFEVGSKQGAGVFFFLFVALAAVCYILIKMIMKQNENRETRYISTIDKLADSFKDVATVNTNVNELRKDISEQKQMLGRVLDRLPTKIDEKE
ncbi:MAG TPA: hypothetical protein IAA29_10140 [Candidatus Paenibacillus intestinavium]|nr:hypothetical protein [Candidatus Paenibacillus intestinavium]